MVGYVLQIAAQGQLRARRVNHGNYSVVWHCASCVWLVLALLQSHLEHYTGTQMRPPAP